MPGERESRRHCALAGAGRTPRQTVCETRAFPVVEAWDADGVSRLRELLEQSHAVIDAVLGTGRSRPIGGYLREALLAVRSERERRPELRVIALDVPSGLDADTGSVDEVCPGADVTVAFGYAKAGLFLHPGADRVGAVEVVDIGLPPGLDDDVRLRLMTDEWASGQLPHRPSDAHKGSFGKTLVVAGSRNYVGAASLAAGGAMRAGAGLVTVAAPERLQAAIMSRSPEPTYLPLPESGVEAARIVLEAASGYDAVLIGCGLGQAPETAAMARELLLSSGLNRPSDHRRRRAERTGRSRRRLGSHDRWCGGTYASRRGRWRACWDARSMRCRAIAFLPRWTRRGPGAM